MSEKSKARRIELSNIIGLPNSASDQLVFEYDKNGRLLGSYYEGSQKYFRAAETFKYGGF